MRAGDSLRLCGESENITLIIISYAVVASLASLGIFFGWKARLGECGQLPEFMFLRACLCSAG